MVFMLQRIRNGAGNDPRSSKRPMIEKDGRKKKSNRQIDQERNVVTNQPADIGELIGVKNGNTRYTNLGGTVSGGVENDDSTVITASDEKPRLGLINYLKANNYWEPLKSTVTFILHFLLVMLVLFLGALAFVYFEESNPKVLQGNHTLQNTTNEEPEFTNETFWDSVVTKYDLTVNEDIRAELMDEFREFIIEDEKRRAETSKPEDQKSQKFLFLKWFYFVTIATTTVGYGDVSPKTRNGRIFYIVFSVVGLGLMMVLMKRCGGVISYANTKVYKLIDGYVCRGKSCLSHELLTAISITLIFLAFLYGGIYYGKVTSEDNDLSLIDLCYYWIVTFTTVGFGDITFPLEKEVENIYFYVIYRIFGLAFLAAIIDALASYAEIKGEEIRKRNEEMMTRLRSQKGEIQQNA